MPADFLQMASFYCAHHHYAHAEDLLSRALAAIRAEKATFGPSLENGPPRIPEAVEMGVVGTGTVKNPVRTKFVAPEYPDIANRAQVQGPVVIESVIDAQGRVLGTRVIRSSNPILDQSAVDAVRQWEYRPYTVDGVPTVCTMSVTVIFSLR